MRVDEPEAPMHRFSSAGWSSDGRIPKTMSSLTWPSTRRGQMIGRSLPCNKLDSLCFSLKWMIEEGNATRQSQLKKSDPGWWSDISTDGITARNQKLQSLWFGSRFWVCDVSVKKRRNGSTATKMATFQAQSFSILYGVFLSRVLKLWQKWMARIAQTNGSSEGPNHTSKKVLFRDVDFQWLLWDVRNISKMSMPLVRSGVWLDMFRRPWIIPRRWWPIQTSSIRTEMHGGSSLVWEEVWCMALMEAKKFKSRYGNYVYMYDIYII